MSLKRNIVTGLFVALLFPISGCSKSGKSGSSGGGSVITLSGNDQMQFDKKTIKVKAGQKVKLVLKHTGKMTKDVMGHNFVLLAKGADTAAFAGKAAQAKETNYIPADMKAQVLANTKVIGGGESTTIEFTAPPAGTYKYLCSFPGHFAMMQGDLISE